MDAEIEAALGTVAADDAAAAERARVALEELGRWGPGAERLGLIQETFLTELVASRPSRALTTIDALGRVFAAAGWSEGARRCRDAQWRSAVATIVARPESRDEVVEGLLARPLQPPRLPDFQWRGDPGPVEHRALLAVAGQLDQAARQGRLNPQRDGWRDQQRAVMRRVLEGRAPELARTWRAAVEHERLSAWMTSRGAGRRALVDAALDDLTAPTLPPPDAATTVAGLRDLLRARRRRPDSVLAALGLHVGLVDRKGSDLRATLLGDSLALDAEQLWLHVCRWALTDGGWTTGVAELVWLQLLRGPATRRELVEQTLPLARGEGELRSQAPATGAVYEVSDVTARAWVAQVVDEVVALAAALRLLGDRPRRGRPVELRDVGWWTVMAMLRGRAVGPRRRYLPLHDAAG